MEVDGFVALATSRQLSGVGQIVDMSVQVEQIKECLDIPFIHVMSLPLRMRRLCAELAPTAKESIHSHRA
ncbi:hypothetical protein SPAR_21100 [Streptomyces sparsogenes DSM 40356]|uniref:Uncharacterized protein n=1 Tax=Streptomyces sparsogenes DSM 40356 TaxID=1331668 RepID=A0A1R1SGQ6_9ACTN|nr:hypothetical protein SPAR_21100 [Streptomyces sparsogenes DSM 40356]